MKKINIKFIAQSAIIAALYAVLTWLLAPISYGAIQFRISEILVLLVIFNPKYAYALIIGCLVANTTSSLGWYDIVFGTFATLIGILPMLKIKRLELAALFPVLSNAIIVAIELYFAFEEAIWLSIFTVGLGEAVVIYCLGIPTMHALTQNEAVVGIMDLKVQEVKTITSMTLPRALMILLGTLGFILYVAYPFTEGNSCLALTRDNLWLIGFGILALATIATGMINKRIIKLILNVLWLIGFITFYALAGVKLVGAVSYPYYYGYIVYLLLFAGISCYTFYYEVKENNLSR